MPDTLQPQHEPLVDRERHSPGLRFLLHLGLPAGISICLHLTLFGLLALKTWQVLRPTTEPFDASQYNVSIAETEAPDFQGFRWPGPATEGQVDPTNFSNFEKSIETDLRGLSNLGKPDLAEAIGGGDPGGFGLGDAGRSGVLGIGGGAGGGGGSGVGEGFGSGRDLGVAGVWDLRVPGNTFAYVVDFSGSIIVAVDDLKRELKRSIGLLRPNQKFNVFIFYSRVAGRGEQFMTESFAPSLQDGDQETKQRFFDWIDRKAPNGSTEPLPAMKRALRLKPDAVFFFSDGYFDDNVVDEIRTANRQIHAQIHCLVFDELILSAANTGLPPRETEGAKRLKRIAEQNQGKIKVVTGDDLSRR